MRIVAAESVSARQQPQRRGRVGRAAAEPGRNRQILIEVKRAQDEPGDARGKGACGFEDEIVGVGTGLRRTRPADGQRKLVPRRQNQAVAAIGEDDQARNFVIALGAATEHPQCQIDLGRRGLGEQ